jgi:hypothetical protein
VRIGIGPRLAAAAIGLVFAFWPLAPAAADEKRVEQHLQAFYELALWNDGRWPVYIRKWTQPIRVRIVGPMSDSYQDFVLGRLKAMAEIAKLEVTVLKPDEKGENFLIEFMDTNALFAGGRSAGCVAYLGRDAELRNVRLALNLRMGFELRQCITHELMHAMGFMGHPHSLDSVLSYIQRREDISEIDRFALRVLYDPAMKPGLYQLPAMALARMVIVDKLIVDGAPEETRTYGQRYIKNLVTLTHDLAEKGNLGLQHQLGVAYTFGQVVEKDEKTGLAWFKRVAEAPWHKDWMGTILEGQFLLGYGLAAGRGATVNLTEAMRWYKSAAERGHLIAQNNLGLLYRDGQGVARDPAEAYKWLTLAADSKYSRAESNLQSLLPGLTPADVAEGKRRATSWKPAQ